MVSGQLACTQSNLCTTCYCDLDPGLYMVYFSLHVFFLLLKFEKYTFEAKIS